MRRMIAVVSLGMLTVGLSSQQKHPFNDRPAEVVIAMGGRKYAGAYRLTEVARICGEVPADLNLAAVPAFIVNLFPENGQGSVVDVTFDSKELVGKTTATTKFYLSLSLRSSTIGEPPAYVLDTSKPGNSGTATLSTPSPGTIELKVKGAETLDGSVEMTLTCKPRVK